MKLFLINRSLTILSEINPINFTQISLNNVKNFGIRMINTRLDNWIVKYYITS